MDDSEIKKERGDILYDLAAMLMSNGRAEAEAVRGYTEQLKLIAKAKVLCGDMPEMIELLDRLEAETEEKTQDELSHGDSLYKEYTALTGIVPKED